eukprot:6787220-Pyramimonas_sp.AAC.1
MMTDAESQAITSVSDMPFVEQVPSGLGAAQVRRRGSWCCPTVFYHPQERRLAQMRTLATSEPVEGDVSY